MNSVIEKDNETPPYLRYDGQDSFFGGLPPLNEKVGYGVILGLGFFLSFLTTFIIHIWNSCRSSTSSSRTTSEFFTTAGRMTPTGLTASVIVSQWTWAATLLQSSNVAWLYGVSGPFWYAAGATIQLLLFGILAIQVKKVAPSAHTICEIVKTRWGDEIEYQSESGQQQQGGGGGGGGERPRGNRGFIIHMTFVVFCFTTNMIVTSMLLLGGAATVEALTGVDYRLASFLIPWGIIFYTSIGGLQATIIGCYIHSIIIYAILITMIYVIYIKTFSSDWMYQQLQQTAQYSIEQCQIVFSRYGDLTSTFYTEGNYSCGPIPGNQDGSYVTMLSKDGFMFGLINIVGNFGSVFVDQAYWQSAIAARPDSAPRGFVLAGLCWFAIPFSLATSLGLASSALQLPINSEEASAGLVPPAVATDLLGTTGAILILVMIFVAIVSTGSTESIAVASLVSYDLYREYWNPNADGEQILFVSRLVVIIFGVFMGCFSMILFEIGLDLGWVYLFMGVLIGPAVAPLWNLLTWKKASGTGAIIAAWVGLALGLTGWIGAAKVYSSEVNIESLGSNAAMLCGNLISILSSAIIHWLYSTFVDPQDYDFTNLERNIHLVENDRRGLTNAEKDPELIEKAEVWVYRRAYMFTLILIVVWPALTIPAGVFTQSYFSFWIMVAVIWGFTAAITITLLPLIENSDTIDQVIQGIVRTLLFCQSSSQPTEIKRRKEDTKS